MVVLPLARLSRRPTVGRVLLPAYRDHLCSKLSAGPSSSSRFLSGLSGAASSGSKNSTTLASDFGHRDGSSITNKATILDDVDAALGLNRPPDLEVLLSDHLTSVESSASVAMHTLLLRYGHVAVRYTTSDGTTRVMNILGALEAEGAQMVNFVPPAEYLYGTAGWETYAQQGGAYNRDIVGVRVERCTPGATDALHAYFEALHTRSLVGSSGEAGGGRDTSVGAARFQLVEARLSALSNQLPPLLGSALLAALDRTRQATDFLSRGARLRTTTTAAEAKPAVPATQALGICRKLAERSPNDVRTATWTAGNCAQWTSSGVAFAGLLRRSRLFPKAILVELLESETSHGREANCHVVVYRHVAHAPPYLPNYRFRRPAYVHPLNPVRNVVYANMHAFADVLVEVAPGTQHAVVRRPPPSSVRRPPRWMAYWRGFVLGAPSLVMVGLVDHIGPLGPASAALWLGLSWWLY